MTNEQETALETIKDFLDGYAERNVERCLALFVSSGPMMLFGTNVDEVFQTPENLRTALTRDFKSMTNIRWGEYRHVHVEAVSMLASVIIDLTIAYRSEGKDVATPFRYAFTLIKEQDRWKISSCLASVPLAAGTYALSE